MSFARLLLFVALLTVKTIAAFAQPGDPIIAAVEAQDWQTARAEIGKVRAANEALFRDKNYEYLLGRIAERTGDTASDLVVHFIVGGSATPGGDYVSIPQTVTIAAGDTSAVVVDSGKA